MDCIAYYLSQCIRRSVYSPTSNAAPPSTQLRIRRETGATILSVNDPSGVGDDDIAGDSDGRSAELLRRGVGCVAYDLTVLIVL